MNVPLVDLIATHREIAEEVSAGWERVLSRTAFILGEEVQEFEEAFAKFSEVEHCIGVGNGTDALELTLRALGIGESDEVIVPANSFIASALAVVRAGATPVLVDCDEDFLIDVDQIGERIGPKTKAVMPVHLYGQVAPMEKIDQVASGRDVAVVEDAAQAQGAKRNGHVAGGLGIAAGVSFYPGKNLGAYGDAGAVLTKSADIAERIRHLRNWGGEVKYLHPVIGFNSRLDTLQAVVLSAKLKRLADWNELRRKAAQRYDELLGDLEEVTRPRVLHGNEHIWHLYVIRVPNRDEVLKKLQGAGIGAGIHYPVPIHLHGAFEYLGYKQGDFPVAEQLSGEILSLPMYPQITSDQQESVVSAIQKALARRST